MTKFDLCPWLFFAITKLNSDYKWLIKLNVIYTALKFTDTSKITGCPDKLTQFIDSYFAKLLLCLCQLSVQFVMVRKLNCGNISTGKWYSRRDILSTIMQNWYRFYLLFGLKEEEKIISILLINICFAILNGVETKFKLLNFGGGKLCPISNLKLSGITSLLSILENFMPEIYTLIWISSFYWKWAKTCNAYVVFKSKRR